MLKRNIVICTRRVNSTEQDEGLLFKSCLTENEMSQCDLVMTQINCVILEVNLLLSLDFFSDFFKGSHLTSFAMIINF